MERRGFACVVVMMMLVGGGECKKRSYADCYGAYYSICMLKRSALYCTAKAVSVCAKTYNQDVGQISGSMVSMSMSMPKPTDVTLKHQFCELGCAISRCTNITTKPNQNVDKLAMCFESCSEETCKPKPSWNAGGNDEQTNVGFCKLGCANSFCGETADINTVCGSCATTCS